MRKYITSFLFLLLILKLFGQQDPEALKILNKLSDKTKSMPSIEAKFNYIVEDKKEGSRFQNEGEIVLKGDKYKLNLLGTTIYYDGKTMWNHIIDVEEVNITEPTEEEMEFFFSKPSRLFFIYESDFKIKYVGETTENNRTLYDIDLFPSDLNKSYFTTKKKLIHL